MTWGYRDSEGTDLMSAPQCRVQYSTPGLLLPRPLNLEQHYVQLCEYNINLVHSPSSLVSPGAIWVKGRSGRGYCMYNNVLLPACTRVANAMQHAEGFGI